MAETSSQSGAQLSTAASSPTPRRTSARRAPHLRKYRSMSANSVSAIAAGPIGSVLVRPQLASGAIQHGIDEFVSVRGSEAPGEGDSLVDRDAPGHFRPGGQLIEADQQCGVLDGVQMLRLSIHHAGEVRIERHPGPGDPLDQLPEILPVGARHVFRVAELLHQVLPRAVVELPPIKCLQCQLACDGARGPEVRVDARGLRHSCCIRETISSAVVIDSPPLLAPLVAALSSACSTFSTVSTPK